MGRDEHPVVCIGKVYWKIKIKKVRCVALSDWMIGDWVIEWLGDWVDKMPG